MSQSKKAEADLASWCHFFMDPTMAEKEDAPDILKKALASLKEISQDEEAREIARRREEYLKAREEEVFDPEEEAWKEGFELGFDEGEYKTRLKILYLLLEDEHTKELESRSLARLTGLSEDDVLEAKRHLS